MPVNGLTMCCWMLRPASKQASSWLPGTLTESCWSPALTPPLSVTLPGQAVQGSSGAWYYSINRQGAIRILNQYLLPQNQLDDNTFDPSGIFDREDLEEFHTIYIAPEASLPLG